MVTLSPVSTPPVNLGQTREQPNLREDALREKSSATKPAGASLAKPDTSSQKNYRESQDFVDARRPDPSTDRQGNRRGSLLDLSV